jgi:hypothetical protein
MSERLWIGLLAFGACVLQEEMKKYDGFDYIKTDLVASKGIIYVKFSLTSSALKAIDDIHKRKSTVRHQRSASWPAPACARFAGEASVRNLQMQDCYASCQTQITSLVKTPA